MPTPSGHFNQRVRVQRRKTELDDLNQPIESWENCSTIIPAKIRQTPGQEKMDSNQVVNHENFVVTIRTKLGIDPTMRILWGTRPLNITSITAADNDPTRREQILLCKT